ncbi:COPI coat complex subunit zeta isoform X1 [Osmia lignaria lignaria]|uniref:coatomer subunit zeta-1 isoform X1 n=1 Tax=Osmia bicornis bicornis TaxID=1437191 RepID=UPI0010F79290|nr:coatomer subunit zeta-1 isoform X1 [Osmia bicornis bicornis]XP_029039113.1 coatomer subunit zeta-1 isoform X1 [Osmia bicornis bicornis]XP_034191935.1 coatomer subunit zeta-1 isoform X1 [Osmia lignaria]XP_034191936.1 coatomer subunit zeta-1 isoform X1 [Osmia lignaria]
MNRGGSSKVAQHNLSPMPQSDQERDFQQREPTLYTVKGMAILDNDGNRILAKYYDKNVFPTSKEQKTFEKNLFNKTHRANAEIIMLDGLTCVYRSNVDLFFYVMGSSHENELILMSVLNCLYDSVSQILRKNVEKRAVLDSLDIVMLAMDEICDGGIILDADASSVVQRVALRTDDIPLGEQTVAQVLQSAKEQLKWSLLK